MKIDWARHNPQVLQEQDIFWVLGLAVGLLLFWIFVTEYYRKKGEREKKAAERRKFNKDYHPGRRASDPKLPEEETDQK